MDWISVKDRLPEDGTPVVALCQYNSHPGVWYWATEFATHKSNMWHDGTARYWLPLPEIAGSAGAAEGGTNMTPKRLSALLVLALAAIALTVCAGLAAGVSMWPWIVGYWAVLTAKNITDFVGGLKK